MFTSILIILLGYFKKHFLSKDLKNQINKNEFVYTLYKHHPTFIPYFFKNRENFPNNSSLYYPYVILQIIQNTTV